MSRRRLSGALILLLVFGAEAHAQETNAPPPKPSKVFTEARRTSEGSPHAFEFELSGFTYQINGIE